MTVIVDSPEFDRAHRPVRRVDRDRRRATSSSRGRSGTGASRRCASATSRATPAGAGRAETRHASSSPSRRSRATAWPTTSTAACSCASRSRAAVRASAATAGASWSPSTTTASTSTAPTTSSCAPRRQHLLHRPRLRALERLDRLQARVRARDKGVYRVPPGGGDVELVVRARRVRAAQRAVLLARRVAALRQRLAPRRDQGVRRRRRRHRWRTCRLFRDEIGSGTMAEGNLDGMECDELGNVWTSGPGGVWVLDPDGERIGAIETPEICGSVAWGGPDLTHAVPDDDDDRALDADARRRRHPALTPRERPIWSPTFSRYQVERLRPRNDVSHRSFRGPSDTWRRRSIHAICADRCAFRNCPRPDAPLRRLAPGTG